MEILKNSTEVQKETYTDDEKEATAVNDVLTASNEPSLPGDLGVLLEKYVDIYERKN